MNRRLSPDFSFEDSRGKLVQLVHEGYNQVNALYSRKGVLRGEHFHKESMECFFVVLGSVSVTIWEKNNTKCEYIYKMGDFFAIFPFEKHCLFFPEDCWMIALYDKAIETSDGKRDIYTV